MKPVIFFLFNVKDAPFNSVAVAAKNASRSFHFHWRSSSYYGKEKHRAGWSIGKGGQKILNSGNDLNDPTLRGNSKSKIKISGPYRDNQHK
jgi:hypothetical protein